MLSEHMKQTYQRYIEGLNDSNLRRDIIKYKRHVAYLEKAVDSDNPELISAKSLLLQLEEELCDRALLGDKHER